MIEYIMQGVGILVSLAALGAVMYGMVKMTDGG